jgi:hypothetical protein
MTSKSAAWLLWAGLVFCWPLPLFGLEGSAVPVARYAQLASALSALAILEGTQGMVGLFLGLLWGHVVVYGLLLMLLVQLGVRFGLASRTPSTRRWLTLALIAVVVIAGSAIGYDTQFHHSEAHASLWRLYR